MPDVRSAVEEKKKKQGTSVGMLLLYRGGPDRSASLIRLKEEWEQYTLILGPECSRQRDKSQRLCGTSTRHVHQGQGGRSGAYEGRKVKPRSRKELVHREVP